MVCKGELIIAALSICLLFSRCVGKEGPEATDNGNDTLKEWAESIPQRNKYHNPVVYQGLPDPTVITGEDGLFYLFATEETRNIPIMVSPNLIDWCKTGTVFNEDNRPSFINKGELWAPDVNRIGNKYVLYYSLATTSMSQWDWAIGVAIADEPYGKWQDKGLLFNGEEIGVLSSIDPCFYSEAGKNWLIWGSYYGIWIIELSKDGLSVKSGAEKHRLASGYGLEGSMIFKKGDKYYLFISEGGTGYEQHYRLGVYKADNLMGPYLNRKGLDAAEDAEAEYFLSAGNGFVSPGHCSEIITDDVGRDWLLYHAFVKGNPGARNLMLDVIKWEDGWPTIGDGHPTLESEIAPSFSL